MGQPLIQPDEQLIQADERLIQADEQLIQADERLMQPDERLVKPDIPPETMPAVRQKPGIGLLRLDWFPYQSF